MRTQTARTQTFTSPQFGSVRTAGTSDNPLFCLYDLSKALGMKSGIHIERLKEGDYQLLKTMKRRQGPHDGAYFVNIRGMRDALLNARSTRGDMIHHWLSREVVPVLTSKKGEAVKVAELPLKQEPKQASVTIEDFIRLVHYLDEGASKATEALRGCNTQPVQTHLAALYDSLYCIKEALLDVMKDIVLSA